MLDGEIERILTPRHGSESQRMIHGMMRLVNSESPVLRLLFQ